MALDFMNSLLRRNDSNSIFIAVNSLAKKSYYIPYITNQKSITRETIPQLLFHKVGNFDRLILSPTSNRRIYVILRVKKNLPIIFHTFDK